ncbi:NIPSNAP family containing protein [Mucilaginibacter pallidiroseus]|uniref:NIPSNAP family containing protein n=1 Tax=Mucilaginibacter pallidiroseus TaxID=2599295 RepID=A0A563UHX8_9SPHI|nr:NIPSNAP family protein [Mucilaginibacter pallidiroseus]TWR30977.1 NIPSNAP family containing protein [Mucilaginibacter pallidiroseus]
MKRRSFVKASVFGSAAATVLPAATQAMNLAKPATAEYYELRIYQLKDSTQQQLIEEFYKSTAIPALNKLGVKHVGVFKEMKPEGQTKLYALIQYNSLQHFETVTDTLANDAAYQAKGSAYLNAPAKQPAYERIETSLMKAFKHSPVLEAPGKGNRIFELRQYQSPSEAAGAQKIEMFNDQGEIDIFKRLGFKPVFWGETLIGQQRPNLTYMVTFDDMDAKAAHWKAFVDDAQWKKISTVPKYADALLVNKITSTMLVPVAFSQI